MSTNETLILTCQATVGDIEPLSDEGSQTFLLHGKRVRLMNKSDKKIKAMYIDGKRIYQKAEGLPMADISRVWNNGGLTITGQATVGDTDGSVVYADTKRAWENGGVVVTGQATVGDTDGTVVYGDTWRENGTSLDYNAFIRYSDHSLVINSTTVLTNATNRVAVFDCLPNTKYTITMNMYSRFRVGSYAGVPASRTVLTNYQCHALDTNNTTTQNGTSQTMTYTTGASDTKLFIGYWTTTDTVKPLMIRQSLTVNVFDYTTKLLLHGTSLTDSSNMGATITNSGTTISTNQYKFSDYPSSYYLDSGNCLTINSDNLFTGNAPFTMEAWIYPTSDAYAKCIFCWKDSNVSLGRGGVISYSGTTLVYYASGTRISGTLTLNTWSHVAFVGNGTSLMLFLNGTLLGTVSTTYDLMSCVDVKIGKNGSYSEYFTGYMAEIRFSKVARWTENFTPPTAPYTAD